MAHCGQMVQVDGSEHDWLEGRGPKMVLMGYIDDASSRFFGRFYECEGVYPAMDSLERYIHRYGRPVSLHIDKHSTYKTSIGNPLWMSFLRVRARPLRWEEPAVSLGSR